MDLTFVKDLPPAAPAWCGDVAETLRAHPGEWAYFPHIGFPQPGADESNREVFMEHFGPADGYFQVKRDGCWFVRYDPRNREPS